jgi:hypothetical protein
LQREIEFRPAGVALTARTAAQLIVDAPAFVAFGTDDIKAAGFQGDFLLRFDIGANGGFLILGQRAAARFFLEGEARFGVAAELNVGPAARHVGGDGDRVRHAGLRDDQRFLFVVFGVEHLRRDLLVLAQQIGEHFRFFDGHRAHQDRLAARVTLFDQLDNGGVFFVGRPVDLVVLVDADARHVGRHVDHFKAVDGAELFFFRHSGPGHAGQLGIHAEVILESDGGQGLVLVLNFDAFLGFDGLVQTF